MSVKFRMPNKAIKKKSFAHALYLLIALRVDAVWAWMSHTGSSVTKTTRHVITDGIV